MSPLAFFVAFAVIAVVMVGVSIWMAWYSRRAMAAHKEQLDDIIREMREMIDKDKEAEGQGGETTPAGGPRG